MAMAAVATVMAEEVVAVELVVALVVELATCRYDRYDRYDPVAADSCR